MEGLPLLPGYRFKDPTVTKYHVSHSFDIKNGHCIPRATNVGIGKEPLDIDSIRFTKMSDTLRFDPTLTYGRTRTKPFSTFKPHFVEYDKKCLAFQAFFKESENDYDRIRIVKIIYFLEDDTITVMEPTVENCGLPQGRLVRRSRIQKNEDGDFWHWKDLNVGMDMYIHGIVYRVCSCDAYTREYLLSQGIELNPEEELPSDPYTQKRKTAHLAKIARNTDEKNSDYKLRRFIEFDGKVLRFFAVWDDRESEEGELRPYVIRYYLADDCVDISEVFQVNSGRDPFPKFLNRMRLPKDWKCLSDDNPAASIEATQTEVKEYYGPRDFMIGNTLFILARRFLIYDCDYFTRRYYSEHLKIDQPPCISVPLTKEKKPYPPMEIPPHIGIGSPDDTLQSCYSFVLKSPKKDVIKYVVNSGKKLRYSATMDWVHPEDEGRDFIIEYFLANSHILITELPKRNSGIKGGRFLAAMLLPKPGFIGRDNPEYYSPSDFALGSVINVFGHRFIITGADLKVYHYMLANVEKFSEDMIASYRNHFMEQGMLGDVGETRISTENSEKCHDTLPEDEPLKAVMDHSDTREVFRPVDEINRTSVEIPPISDSIETKVIDAALKPKRCCC